MSEEGVEGISPMAVLLVGLLVYVPSFVGLFTSELWAEPYRLSQNWVSTVLLVGLGAGLILTLYGCHAWRDPQRTSRTD